MQNSVTQMELRFLQHSSSPLTTLPSSLLFRSNVVKRRYLYDRFIRFSGQMKYPCARSLQKSQIRAQLPSGATRFSSSTVEAMSETVEYKAEDVVYVAGATGKVGSRTVRELLKLGFRVKAGVRSAQRAESLVQSVRQMKVESDAKSGCTPIEMLEIVECDLEKPGQIVPALGKASVVICCIGASEKEISDVTGPYRIDFLATKNLIEAATVAKVNHFMLVTSLGTNKFGFPAAILNLFWGVLCWKRKAEEALISSGLPYTIVRPGGMERPTDSFKETHNITLAQEDTLFGGLVSNLQVAELLAFMAQNRNLSYCKIMEVVAETTAPLTPMAELLVKIPSKREDLQKPEEQAAITEPLDVEPAKSFISEVVTDVTEKKPVQDTTMLVRPLSPYTMYDDLKPPSSLSPTAPGGQVKEIVPDDTEPSTLTDPTSASETNATSSSETETDTLETGTVKLQPLSPYTAYEDLKPPSSPSPSPPGSSREESMKASITVDNGVPKVIDGTLIEDVQQETIFYHSPFPVYEDFKPPTSPTPSAPNSSVTSMTSASAESQMASLSSNGPLEPVEAHSDAGDEQASIQPKPRPLSPYTMYEDLKPPSSPTPSSPGNH